ncbi:MAG: hypothetical protein H8E16_00555 [Flavobacteriales bacterium]|nr:hypothetical protein [Flavobacteriales bacterium]
MEEKKPKANTPEYRAWYYRNKYKAKGKASKKEKEKRNKNFVIRYRKQCSCIKCGLKKWYIIEFHHLDPSKKYKSITDLQFNAYSIKTIKKEIRKCVAICLNCHMEFHYLERNKLIKDFKEYLKWEYQD